MKIHKFNRPINRQLQYKNNNENKMTKRIFFTDPIKAAYMMREFGVKLHNLGIEELLEGAKHSDVEDEDKIYVKKESEHIFQAKEGNDGMVKTRLGKTFGEFRGGYWRYYGLSMEEVMPITIMRANKQFFTPEV